MKYVVLMCAVIGALLAMGYDAPVGADEPAGSLLERLNQETAKIVAKADATWVHVRRGNRHVRGVLVGSPPRVVVPYIGDRTGPSIFVRLSDGREYGSSLVDSDPELGVSVCVVPEGWAAKLQGLSLGSSEQIRRGALGVLGGTKPSLVLIDRVDRARGRFLSDVRGDAAALLGPGGKLLGLRASVAGNSCSACHTTPVVGTGLPAGSYHYGSLIDSKGRLVARSSTDLASDSIRYWIADKQGKRYGVHGNRVVVGKDGHVATYDPAKGHVTESAYIYGATGHARDYISAPVIRRVLRDIDAHGKIQHGYLGVVPGRVDAKQKGIRISSVIADSPASKAGIKAGDVVTKVDDIPCTSPAAFTVALAHWRPGDTIRLSLAGRDPIAVQLGNRTAEMKTLLTAGQLGITGRALDDSLRAWLGVPADVQGVVVVGVSGHVPAHSGIRRGDVILEVGGNPVRDLDELDAAFATAKDGVQIKLQRASNQLEVRIAKLPKPDSRAAPR